MLGKCIQALVLLAVILNIFFDIIIEIYINIILLKHDWGIDVHGLKHWVRKMFRPILLQRWHESVNIWTCTAMLRCDY